MAPTKKKSRLAALFLPLCLAAVLAHAQAPTASLGKQRAAASRFQWETGSAGHPILGSIRFAFMKDTAETAVGGGRIYSRAYVSCQRRTRGIAIELTNVTGPSDLGGLRPAMPPRLVCNRLSPMGDGKLVEEELMVAWEVNQIGDALARDLPAAALRDCVSIDVVQDVVLPAGWGPRSARVQFDIAPYNRQLDEIFATCGEKTAYSPAAAVKAASVRATPAASVRAAPAASASSWRNARTTASGKTNVRSGPTTHSRTVIQLDPGAVILVQRAGGDWWRARPARGTNFEGYIREDRLVLQ